MVNRENLIRLALVSISTFLLVLLLEVAVRASIWSVNQRTVQLEDGLEQSEQAQLGTAENQPYSLRGLVRASPLPNLVYELKPNLVGAFRGHRVETNSQGLRDREYTREKSEDTYRIVGLGDSVMFGWGVGQDESYLEVLETRFATDGLRDRRVEVLNFAVPGYNTAMEVAAFEHKVLAYDPDLVVLHFVVNDLRLPHFMQAPANVLSWRRSYLLEWTRSRLGTVTSTPESGDGLLDHGLDALPAAERQEIRQQYRHLAGADGFRVAVKRLAELTGPRSIPVVVMRLSDQHEHQGLVLEAIDQHGFDSVVAGPYFQDYLQRSGRPPGELSWRKAFWVATKDSHPNVLGHELFATALWDFLGDGRHPAAEEAGDFDHR